MSDSGACTGRIHGRNEIVAANPETLNHFFDIPCIEVFNVYFERLNYITKKLRVFAVINILKLK